MILDIDQIDELVDSWHNMDSRHPLYTIKLHEWLGWTWEEFGAWLADPTDIPDGSTPLPWRRTND
jgi:hypothetical protein